MTNKEAINAIKCNYPTENYTVLREALDKAIEALEECEKNGTCKECGAADFCYNRKDACYCLRHNHIMYADDSCNYFYKGDEDWSDE